MGGGENDGKTTPGFFSALTSFGSNFLKARKPWSELYDYRSISTPHGIWDYTSRLRKNSVYFGVNYVIFLFSIMIGIVAFRPTSLGILVALTMLWVYMLIFRKADLTVRNPTRIYSDQWAQSLWARKAKSVTRIPPASENGLEELLEQKHDTIGKT